MFILLLHNDVSDKRKHVGQGLVLSGFVNSEQQVGTREPQIYCPGQEKCVLFAFSGTMSCLRDQEWALIFGYCELSIPCSIFLEPWKASSYYAGCPDILG